MTSFAAKRFEIGRVISHTLSVITSNFGPLAGFSLLMFAVPQLVTQAISLAITNSSGVLGSAVASFLGVIALIVFAIIGVAASVIANAGIIYGSVNALNGRSATIPEMFSRGWSKAGILFGLAIIQGLATGLGFVFLIVPGFILMVM